MKKKTWISILLIVTMLTVCTSYALAYGTKTETVNGTEYTITDAYSKTKESGKVGGTATCKITPKHDHYSTSDIRANSSAGKVYKTSGRCWVYGEEKSTATCVATKQSDLLGYGWWGGLN